MIITKLPPDELYHHGIKGQRWGIRKYQNADGSLTAAGKDRYVRSKRSESLKNRRLLSDDDLRKRINRLKMEAEYKRLSEDDIKPGKKFCDNFLRDYGKSVLTAVATGATMFALNYAITREATPEMAARYIAPPPKSKK